MQRRRKTRRCSGRKVTGNSRCPTPNSARPRDLRQGLAILGKLARDYEAAAKRAERDGDRDALRLLVCELPWFRKQLEKLPELMTAGQKTRRLV